ncbi:proton-conducting transporter transmembrane domain-containing protein [Dyadobacter pollutisoli]|uniref:Proton-conducting transporter membrane subunit n=1 Tax=Dyadobacter pollutisoli TaxID=2910158 RepID=A0A9E8NC93_9BACT|nr:proton-conducting transporter membrane subunit [Dyadobacter pollutisoli]WAC12367.1 proton-conducting transporter membrane subunit [Dyadobacter pollutisoli]
MISLIPFLVLLPVIGFLVSVLISSKKENLISRVTFSTVGLHMVATMFFLAYWILHDHPVLDKKDILLFKSPGYEIFIDFYFDKITATYLFVGAFLTFLIVLYSRDYLHREKGYKRFFNTILFFYVGYNLVIFSGNLETLFVGWEILGISSFLLIAFYRERYLPVKNAVKVFSIYRIADVGLILAIWASHHLWHENITFLKLGNYEVVHEHLQSRSLLGIFISLMILITASVKSAQLPFSPWLPRAMEGPTPSSAIFYGSLSVHLGVFLLLRTFMFWEHQLSVRILIGLVGFTTTAIATGIARVQSSVKSQIAYASIAQIGLIFIEVAAGFENLAMVHFAGNAFLRTYQLLVSPSVVSYLIREQFYNFSPRVKSIEDSFPKKLQYTFYILCIKEWNLDSFLYRFLWNPLKMLSGRLNFLTFIRAILIFLPAYLIGLFCVYHKEIISQNISAYLPFTFSLIGLIMVLKSFTERLRTRMSWLLVIMNHFGVALAISFNENFSFDQIHLYLSGVVVSGVVGYLVLNKLKSIENNIGLDQFHGHSYKHPGMALIFLLCCLGLSGFPITPTFIGEDVILSHIHENQIILASFTALSLIIDGLAIIRIYALVFLGPHAKSIDEMAYRSS